MKGFKEAYKSIFHYYNEHDEHGPHENSFYISNMHWIHFIPDQFIYEYLTWLQTGVFTLISDLELRTKFGEDFVTLRGYTSVTVSHCDTFKNDFFLSFFNSLYFQE